MVYSLYSRPPVRLYGCRGGMAYLLHSLHHHHCHHSHKSSLSHVIGHHLQNPSLSKAITLKAITLKAITPHKPSLSQAISEKTVETDSETNFTSEAKVENWCICFVNVLKLKTHLWWWIHMVMTQVMVMMFMWY